MPFSKTPKTAHRELSPLPSDDDTLISAEDLPQYIGVARQTLARWRTEGFGPPFVKLGHRVLYRTGAVRNWLAQATRNSTSESSPHSKRETQKRTPLARS